MAAQACDTCGAVHDTDARFCSSCGAALTLPPIEGERRLATVLFADVVGSTGIAEQLDPEDWTQIMNGAFGLMNAAVSRYEGTVARLLGDAILAIFGAPVAHEEDAERAVRAALEIQDSVVPYAQSVSREYSVDFALRVGISTGTVVLSVVGDSARSEYTAIGDAANVAARLQSLARPGTVAIDAATQRLVHPLFDIAPRGLIEVKGKREPVACFEVTGIRAVPGRVRGLEGLESPVVGREREMGVLRERLDALGRGSGSVVALVGEAGLGKSRLVAELRSAAAGATWLEGRAISYGQSIPYHPWRQLGRLFIGATDADPPAVVQDKLRSFVERMSLPASDLPFLETMMAVETDGARRFLAQLNGEDVTAGAARAVMGSIRSALRLNGGTPHVLVMEDLHWADHASLELLAEVATLAESEPLLLVCALRPDRQANSWPFLGRLAGRLGDRLTRLDLEPLDRSASEQLLGNLLMVDGLGDTIRSLILDRSEGNPFYIEEVLRSLIDAGHLEHTGSQWRVTGEIGEAQIPETLSGVLSARIDRLPDKAKRVAQTASVIGRVFQQRVLESVCRAAPHPIEPVEPHLSTLSMEQLVRERAHDPEREYIFKHALTCEAAYSLLLRSRRRELHALCGTSLERLYPERRGELAPVLAHHFAEARENARALTYYRLAAENAQRLYALTEELQHRDAILRIHDRAAPSAEAIDDVLAWVLVRHRLNQYDGVVNRLTRTTDAARALGDERRLAELLSWTGNIHMVTGFPSHSIPYLVESREIAKKLGNDSLMLLPLWMATWSLVDRDPKTAVDALRQVIEMAHSEGVTDVEAHARGDLSIALARLGRYEESHVEIDRALALAPHAGSPVKEADVHISVGQAFREMGELDKSLEHARIGAEGAYAVNGMECACAGYYGLGRTELDLRHPDRAIGDFDQSEKIAQLANAVQSVPFIPLIRAGKAVAQFQRGDTKAVEDLRQVIRDAESSHDDFVVGGMSSELAEVLMALGRPEEAQAPLEKAVTTYRRLEAKPFLARALEVMGKLRDALGDNAGATAARAESQEIRAGLPASAVEPTAT